MGAKNINRMQHMPVSNVGRSRARHVKCDETYPTCNNCRRQGTACNMSTPQLWRSKPGEVRLGYEQQSSSPSSSYAQHSFGLPAAVWSPSHHASTAEHDWMEACYNWGVLFRRIHPERRITKQMPYSELSWFFYLPDIMRPIVILGSLAPLVLEESADAPNYTNFGKKPDAASYIKKYKHYHSMVLSSISRDVNNHDFCLANMVLRRLGNFIQSEIVLNSRSLPLHLKGFATIVSVRGGIRKVLERQETAGFLINNMLAATTALNTTSPAKACLPADIYATDDYAYLVYADIFLEHFPCPTQLYRCLVDINQLRVQQQHAAAGPCDGQGIRDAVATVYASVQGFEPEAWSERPKLRSAEVRHLMAQVYQAATELYLQLSLVQYVSSPLTASQRIDKAKHTTALAERLVAICGHHVSVAWPLTVAGAALGRAPVCHQEAVDRHLLAISRMISNARGVALSLQCLRKFWASGKTGWEDCFSEWHLCCF
ncbi:hypothetical protein PWT90_05884 [Aphanocladium album]|nr:hypothetical protein PWT90_05884 [Aphanocladium album]